jgi:hypothetical protein
MAHDSLIARLVPQFITGGANATAADLSEIAKYAGDYGNFAAETDALRLARTGAALWSGLTVYTTDTKLLWQYDGSWATIAGQQINFQVDTTNSLIVPKIQAGIGKVTGTGATSVSEAVTYPSAYGTIAAVTASYLGARVAGAFNAFGLSGSNTGVGDAQVQSTTGFNVALSGVGTYAATTDYYYSWIAVGF